MNLVDLTVAAMLVAGLVGGWRTGLVARLLSWIGLAAGLLLAVRALPTVVGWVEGLDPLVQFLAAASVLVGFGLSGQATGFALGARLRRPDTDGRLPRWDRWCGVGAGAVGTIVLLWLLLPIAANAPSVLSDPIRASRSAQLFDRLLPTPPDALEAMQGFAGPGFPRVFEAFDPSLPVSLPPGSAGLTAETERRVATAIVRVQGPACYRLQTGTGFVVEPGYVMTNAHVIAGVGEVSVIRDDGARLRADPVVFDPGLDLALLRVPTVDRPALELGTSTVGDRGGVFGHPMGQPLRVAPFQTDHRVRALGRDIYDAAPVLRDVLVLASSLTQGDSGAPMVDEAGAVVGVAFAVAPDQDGVAYGLSTGSVREVLGRPRAATSTGRCTG